ncbi:MAG: hypothetical protein AAF577_02640 [Pseudomonadota bacterium]
MSTLGFGILLLFIGVFALLMGLCAGFGYDHGVIEEAKQRFSIKTPLWRDEAYRLLAEDLKNKKRLYTFDQTMTFYLSKFCLIFGGIFISLGGLQIFDHFLVSWFGDV